MPYNQSRQVSVKIHPLVPGQFLMDDNVCVDLNTNSIKSFDGNLLSYIYQHQKDFSWIQDAEHESAEKARDIIYMNLPDRPSLMYENSENILDDMSIEGDNFLDLIGFWESDEGKMFGNSLSELNYHEQSDAICDKINSEMRDKFIEWKQERLSQEEEDEGWKYEPKDWEVSELSLKILKPIAENAAYESGLMTIFVNSNTINCCLSEKYINQAKKFFSRLMSGTASSKGSNVIDGSYKIKFHSINHNVFEELSLSKLN